MRVTVCELPHEPASLASAWAALCRHTREHASELVLLPEFAFVEPVWETEHFEASRWAAAEAHCTSWLSRLQELGAAHVVGTHPVSVAGRPLNRGFSWSAAGLSELRSKFFLPAEPGGWETNWFDRGDPEFPAYQAGPLSFGLNICTELWALETYGPYAAKGVHAILSPRATAAATRAKWLSAGVVAAVRSGAYSLSSNRVDSTGACGGLGWIISPEGQVLAGTTEQSPYATVEIDLKAPGAAANTYPRYVFRP
ncbi:MAG TPA: carbon-nitrogen hydrolase family protein [Opitutaceae bacterium]|jgi:N-carbamoylputrescine amidase|nr:carbon-nitrogen hydrolase family protein [Opitutaceae bacterium]